MLSEVIQVAVWVDHVKDHGLALCWNHVHASRRLCVSPTWKGCLATPHPLVKVDTEVDGA